MSVGLRYSICGWCYYSVARPKTERFWAKKENLFQLKNCSFPSAEKFFTSVMYQNFLKSRTFGPNWYRLIYEAHSAWGPSFRGPNVMFSYWKWHSQIFIPSSAPESIVGTKILNSCGSKNLNTYQWMKKWRQKYLFLFKCNVIKLNTDVTMCQLICVAVGYYTHCGENWIISVLKMPRSP